MKKPAPAFKARFCAEMKGFSDAVHKLAVEKGWWSTRACCQHSDNTKVLLMHAELSEATEALRAGNPVSAAVPEFTKVEEELADVVLRIMDYSAAHGYDIGKAVAAKHKFNRNREFRHGNKAF